MTILRLNANRAATMVNAELYALHARLTGLMVHLRDGSVEIDTGELQHLREEIEQRRSRAQNYKTTYGTWYASAWPGESVALDGALTSLVTIRDGIGTVLSYYVIGADTKLVDVSMAHRGALANGVETELEA